MKKFFVLVLLISFLFFVPNLAFGFAGPAPEGPSTTEAGAPPQTGPKATEELTPAKSTSEVKTNAPAPKGTTATPSAKTAISAGELYKVRVGLFSKKDSAIGLMNTLKAEGYGGFLISQAGLWRVQVGAYKEGKKADEIAGKLRKKGYSVDVVVSK